MSRVEQKEIDKIIQFAEERLGIDRIIQFLEENMYELSDNAQRAIDQCIEQLELSKEDY